MNRVLSTTTASVTELKRNYAHVLEASEEEPVAILNHNRPEAYLLPATYYEKMLAYIEDLGNVLRENVGLYRGPGGCPIGE